VCRHSFIEKLQGCVGCLDCLVVDRLVVLALAYLVGEDRMEDHIFRALSSVYSVSHIDTELGMNAAMNCKRSEYHIRTCTSTQMVTLFALLQDSSLQTKTYPIGRVVDPNVHKALSVCILHGGDPYRPEYDGPVCRGSAANLYEVPFEVERRQLLIRETLQWQDRMSICVHVHVNARLSTARDPIDHLAGPCASAPCKQALLPDPNAI
jgi:hypothetical protein